MSKRNALGLLVLVSVALAPAAFAQGNLNCIVVKNTAEVEKVETDAQGKKSTSLVPLTKAIPGTEVIYTTTVTNNCKLPAEKFVISNFVPAHMSYVSGSSFSPGAQVTFSLDKQTFGTPDQLTVAENGANRKARAEEYRFFHWTLQSPLQPGASAFARFRAVVN